MQFRRVGRRVQVLRYEGYDPIEKRSRVRMVGSYDWETLTPDESLLKRLNDAERAELESRINAERMRRDRENRVRMAECLPDVLRMAADTLLNDGWMPDEGWAADVKAAWATLRRAMRRRSATFPPPVETPRPGAGSPR